jgi:hypothetical protein
MAISSNTTGLRPGVCTSTTRPTAPYEGQTIYETDTDKVLVWNGSAWYPNWNLPWGIVDEVSTATTHYSTTTIADISGLSINFTAVANRYYEYKFHCANALSTTTGAVRVRLDFDLDGVAIGRDYSSSVQGGYPLNFSGLILTSAGSKTLKVRSLVDVGSSATLYADTTSLMRLYIKDIGPA